MKSELHCCTIQQTGEDEAKQNDQDCGHKPPHNISVQTGEEFSPEFSRDHVTSRGMKDFDQIPTTKPGFDIVHNNHLVHHEDLTGHIGIRRKDSEICTECSDFSPSKGYGLDVEYKTYLDGANRYYRGSPSGPPIYLSGSPNSFSGKIKFLCSFGGKIFPRPSDGKLRYVGGETRIISIRKNLTYSELVKKTSAICNQPHTIRYQLPGEDLDSLISVSSDEDLHHMIEEYHDLERISQRLRLFLVSSGDSDCMCSLEARTVQQSDSDYQYVVAVNGMVDPTHRRSSSRDAMDTSAYDHARCFDAEGYYRNYPTDHVVLIGSPSKNGHMQEPRASPMLRSHLRKPSTDFESPSSYGPSGFETSINNDYASDADFMGQKWNLSKIICQPDLKHSVHVAQIDGGKNSASSYNSAEDIIEVWKASKPEYLVKSQKASNEQKHHIRSAINCNVICNACHGLQHVASEINNQSQLVSPSLFPDDEISLGREEIMYNYYERQDKDSRGINSYKKLNIGEGTLIHSVSLDNCHETGMQELPVIVEDVTCNVTPEVVPYSDAVPHIEDETEAECVIPEPDYEDVEVDKDNKDDSVIDAAVIEKEAGIYGLQIIRNADLEDLQELGSGTFGTVYHGKWRGTDVAIKRIQKSCFSGKSSEQERLTQEFWREAQILSKLHHPNVVAFYGVVPDGPGGTFATVTEYMANGSLRHVLFKKDRALDRRKKVMLALDAAIGMEYLHLKNIVHFDLKCDNLLVNLGDPQRPVCKVGDFGLSKIKQNTLVSGGVRGTLPWMAPELLNGNSTRVSEKVDVFSFGIAMWEILAGEEPYVNMHCGAIIGGIVNNTLRPPIPEPCDPEWRKLMEECWSHDPEARPSFTEITNRLRVMSTALQPKRYNRVIRR